MPLARWCGAVRAFAQGAEPLAGNCCLVAGQWLSPSGEYRQPLNITVPRYLIWPNLVNRGRADPRDLFHVFSPSISSKRCSHRMGNATRGSFEATMDHTDIRGLVTALHCSVAGLPRSSIGDHPEGCPHSTCEDSPHRVPRIALPIRSGADQLMSSLLLRHINVVPIKQRC